MIEIVCDNCERTLEVEDEHAGGKVACPHCGDVNRVPDQSARPVAQSAASPATSPAPSPATSPPQRPEADLPPETGPEQDIRVVRPAMFRAHPFRFILIALIVLGGLVAAVWCFQQDRTVLAYVGLAVTLVGLVWLAKWWVATTLWIKVTITNKRTIRHEGIVRRHSTEVLHDHVRSVDINQGFVQRLCNVGYIGIDSAGQDDIEIQIRDIPGPYEVKRVIDRYRKM